MRYFSWKLELVSNIVWMIVAWIEAGKDLYMLNNKIREIYLIYQYNDVAKTADKIFIKSLK